MTSALKLLSLTDRYERKARLLPALLAAAPVLPGVGAVSSSWVDWLASLAIGTGLGAVIAVGLSHLASAAGHWFEARMVQRWGGLPTDMWLRPEDQTRSIQQKNQWYAAIKKLTGLDLAKVIREGDAEEVRKTIRDATAQLRHRFRNAESAGLLHKHNEDYGFARNFAGLVWVWLPASVASVIASACQWRLHEGSSPRWLVASAVVTLICLALPWIMPGYVRTRANRYAESLFGTVVAESNAERMRPRAAISAPKAS